MKLALYAALPLMWLATAPAILAQVPVALQSESIHTFYLRYSRNGSNDSNEVLTAVRILLPPSLHVYLDVHQNAIIVRATPEQVTQIEQIIGALDKPIPNAEGEPARNSFRLTYTVSELDDGKRVSLQHFSTVIVEGGHTTLKDGTSVPVRTGPAAITTGNVAQFSYLDVGFNFDSSLDNSTNGERLRAKIEQASAIADVQDGMQNPIKRQASLELTAYLQPGKPLVLGSMDVPGSGRHVEIEALLESIR